MLEIVQIFTFALNVGCSAQMEFCKDEPTIVEIEQPKPLTVEDVTLNDREPYIVPFEEESDAE